MKRSYYPNWLNTRMGFILLLAFLMWAKTLLAYIVDFNLSIDKPIQYFILIINPIGTVLFFLSISLYIRNPKISYTVLILIDLLMTILLFANVSYYREFSDFLTINTMLGSSKVSAGLGESALRMLRPYDIFYVLDLLVIILLLLCKKIKIDPEPMRARYAFAVSSLSALIFSINVSLAEIDRPELLQRTFSRDYIVKYLGINAFTIHDGVQTYNANQIRAKASPNDLEAVETYVSSHYAAPNESMFGIAKGRNVIYIHLESFQQFLINYKLKDENGLEHEVTPFLNSLYNGNSTYSFDNFFHQVSAGKTSDAETLLENSLFGLQQGPLFTQMGGENTFQAAPAILGQEAGYTSAVFHGNAGNFWNRNETYKRLGFNYFFDSRYYNVNDDNSFMYGLHDKPMFQQSVQYLEHMQQPFYSKFIAVSNHYPYSEFKGDEAGFPLADTKDATINGYFATANYLDKAVEEFFTYLKESGLYENSVIVLYGDHYGISSTRNPDLAELIGKSKEEWSEIDNAELQRVPFMINIPGRTDGSVSHQYGGQIDVLPTLLHLLGIDTKNYIQLGSDLFSANHDQVVAFRNGNFVSPKYTVLGNNIYDTATGEQIESPSVEVQQEVDEMKAGVDKQLEISDAVTNGDLLRYYGKSGLTPVQSADYNYKYLLEQMEEIEQEKGADSASLYSKNGNQSTVDLYQSKSYKEYYGPSPDETASSSSK